MLQGEVENIMQEWQSSVNQLTIDKEKAEKSAAKALKQLEKIRNAPKAAPKAEASED